MQSLKKLVKQNGVTVCAVIHQPRKVIFDLFDSIILLSVGGKAKDYFHSRGYQLPEGESVADWLIDISSGQLAPDEELLFENQAKAVTSSKRMGTAVIGDSSEVLASAIAVGGASSLGEDESDILAFRREQLSNGWIEYFDKKNKHITKKSRQMYYSKPAETELPRHIIKPTFLEQFIVQLDRAIKVGGRNVFYKFVDTCIIVFFGILITWMQGTSVLSVDADPQGIRLKYLITESPTLLETDSDNFFEQLFAYAIGANEDFRQ
jgi:ABC-2 type transporter